MHETLLPNCICVLWVGIPNVLVNDYVYEASMMEERKKLDLIIALCTREKKEKFAIIVCILRLCYVLLKKERRKFIDLLDSSKFSNGLPISIEQLGASAYSLCFIF